MQEIIKKYKNLKSQLTENVDAELSNDEFIWNDMIYDGMEELLKDLPKDTAEKIRLGHI